MGRTITGIGETILDIVFKGDRPTAAIPGGSTFNSMISLGRTVGRDFPDTRIRMVTQAGNDHVGDIITSFMQSNGVGTGSVTRTPGTQTPVSLAFLDDSNDAHYQFYKDPGASGFRNDKSGETCFAKDDIVLFGSYFAINPTIRDYTFPLLQKAAAGGAILSYDINFRRSHLGELPQLIGNVLENCRMSDIVRGSLDDFSMLFGITDPERIYREHMCDLCPILICTCGADPVHIFTPGLHLKMPVPQVKTVSTIGAGDNFNAGVIYSIISLDLKKDDIPSMPEETWRRIVRAACSFSAEVCGSMDNYVGKEFLPDLEFTGFTTPLGI